MKINRPHLKSLFNQKGFSHVELFIAIVIIAGVAFVGIRVMEKSHAASNCTVSPILLNSCHPLIASYVQGYPGVAGGTAPSVNQTEAAEKRIGSNFLFNVIHTDYHRGAGGDTLTPEETYFATKTNQTVFLNWWPTKNWAQGDTSAIYPEVDAMANSIKSAEKVAPFKLMMSLQHEMNDKVSKLDSPNDSTCSSNVSLPGSSGTPEQYRNMVINVENRFKADGIDNSSNTQYIVWAILFESFNQGNDNAFPNCLDQALYPGNAYVDWLGWDTYGNGAAYTGKTGSGAFQETAGVTYKYMQNLSNNPKLTTYGMMNKPIVLGEFSSCRSGFSTQQNADYFKDAKYSLDQHLFPDIQLYMVFDAPGTGHTGLGGCMLGYTNGGQLDSAGTVQNAFNSFATDPIFNGSNPKTPPPNKQPVIDSFSATPSTVKVGASSKLAWNTTNVTSCTLTPGGPKDTTATSWTTPVFTATGSHSYSLSCENSHGTTSATTTVTVSTKPVTGGLAGVLCEATASDCVSLPAGGSPSDAEVISVISKASAWKWDETNVGTVSSSWPFTVNSLANYYKGDQVVKFVLDDNNGYCLANSGTSVLLRVCDVSVPPLAPQTWVVSGNWLVNPAASDNNSAKYVLTNDNGTAMDQLGSNGNAKQNWQFEPTTGTPKPI